MQWVLLITTFSLQSFPAFSTNRSVMQPSPYQSPQTRTPDQEHKIIQYVMMKYNLLLIVRFTSKIWRPMENQVIHFASQDACDICT